MSQRTERNQSIDKAACWRNRQAIALLAAGNLQDKEAESLKKHLETCSGCRRYWHELTDVAAGLMDSHLEAEVEPSAAFHNKLMRRLRQEPAGAPSRRVSEVLASLFEWRWQTAGAAFALIVVLLAIVLVAVSPSKHGSRRISSYTGLNQQGVKQQSDPSPTLAAYQAAASQSLETFDALLTWQANRPTPAMPMYRASPLAISLAE